MDIEPLRQKTIAISISESGDMASLGLAEEHLRDAMAEIARHLLAMGARLVYGGDLRAYGFSELLFELVSRHRRDLDGPGIASYLAWPIHRSKSAAELRALAHKLDGIADLHCLDLHGSEIWLDQLMTSSTKVKSQWKWAQGLTAMRQVLTSVSDACVVLGGRVTHFRAECPPLQKRRYLRFKWDIRFTFAVGLVGVLVISLRILGWCPSG